MSRVSAKDLEHAVKVLNNLANTPTDPSGVDGKANIGNYHIDSAYGGYKLVQMHNAGWGTKNITHGFISKRDLYYQILAYTAGVEAGQK